MIWALKLLGIGKTIMGWLREALRWVFAKWHRAVIVGLLLIIGVQAWQNSGLRHTVQKHVWREAGFLKFAYDVGYNSEKARQAQIAMNQENTDKQITIERLNRETSNLRQAAIRDASTRYADRNRLSKVCPSRTDGTNPAAQDNPPQGGDEMQASAILVSERDFNVLNERTADAIRYEEWARGLVAAGLAVEAE